jgi:aminocarboxymuconate-semialdehyde decarboxylase
MRLSRREFTKAMSWMLASLPFGASLADAQTSAPNKIPGTAAADKGIPAIDLHCHAQIPKVDELVIGQPGWQEDLQHMAAIFDATPEQFKKSMIPAPASLTSLDLRLKTMNATGIDIQAVSLAPPQYNYWADRSLAEKIVAAANEGIAEVAHKKPDRLVGLGSVALQHPDLAAAQVEHAVKTLHLKGVIINTDVDEKIELADPRNEPFWAKAEEVGAVVFIHPIGCSMDGRLAPYLLSNVIGNPLSTTIALSKIVFAGVLDRYPRLKILGAHGGGYFPFYVGRFDQIWRVMPPNAKKSKHLPSEYLHRLYFDDLVYRPESISFLVSQAGSSQVVLGTDYPYNMGEDHPLEKLGKAPGLSDAERRAVRGGNAMRLLGLEK